MLVARAFRSPSDEDSCVLGLRKVVDAAGVAGEQVAAQGAGVFAGKVANATRILPTEVVDVVSLNKWGRLAIIELEKLVLGQTTQVA